jgi:hypothetical protein
MPNKIVFRVQGLPAVDDEQNVKTIRRLLEKHSPLAVPHDITIVPTCDSNAGDRTALVTFSGTIPSFLPTLNSTDIWVGDTGDGNSISFDCHFHGFTQLYPIDAESEDTVEYVDSDYHFYSHD